MKYRRIVFKTVDGMTRRYYKFIAQQKLISFRRKASMQWISRSMIDVNKCVALRVRYYRTVADYYCAEFARTQNNILTRRGNLENLQSNSEYGPTSGVSIHSDKRNKSLKRNIITEIPLLLSLSLSSSLCICLCLNWRWLLDCVLRITAHARLQYIGVQLSLNRPYDWLAWR